MMTSSSDELLGRGVEPVIVIDHLRVIRGKRPAIHDLSVQIARGTITGLLGPSGCGKTTLMRSIVGTQILTAFLLETANRLITVVFRFIPMRLGQSARDPRYIVEPQRARMAEREREQLKP